MAIVKFGGIVTLGVGKLGGHVFQRCRETVSIRTNYFRSSDANTFPRSTAEAFSIARARWAEISNPDAAEWGALAAKLPVPDWDGDNQYLTARQFHYKTNVQTILSGDMAIIDPFTYSNYKPTMVVFSAVWNVSDTAYQVTYQSFPEANSIGNATYLTYDPDYSPDLLDFSLLPTYVGNGTDRPLIAAELFARYGVPEFNATIWLYCRPIVPLAPKYAESFVKLSVVL